MIYLDVEYCPGYSCARDCVRPNGNPDKFSGNMKPDMDGHCDYLFKPEEYEAWKRTSPQTPTSSTATSSSTPDAPSL